MTLDATYYQKNSNIQLNLANELLIQHHFKEDDFVLDVGCGDGKITDHIASLVCKGGVLGIDPSSEMIAFLEV